MRNTLIGKFAIVFSALLCALSARAAADEHSPFWTNPEVVHYGAIHYLPDAAFKPDATKNYKIVFSIEHAAQSPDTINPALDSVARTVNLYAASGVPLSHLKIVAVAYGAAAALALDDAHYRATFGVPNPNLPVIAELKKAGVTIAVCGQAMAKLHYDYGWVANNVTLALSGLTTVTTLESEGYVFMPL